MKTVFVDSSVLLSAVNSPIGGSTKLFTLTKISLITSRVILTETERNIRAKLESYHLERFFKLVGKMTIADHLSKEQLIKKAKKIIAEKDAVILAEAKEAAVDFLITLDKKHFLTDQVSNFLKPKKVLIPKMLLNKDY
ncbi:PIN domain-containing protein [Candidatus Daviesbacteria bacterium]|nr:PIN domain-containing protein [Candidatus Daviesbacteria bacterium]